MFQSGPHRQLARHVSRQLTNAREPRLTDAEETDLLWTYGEDLASSPLAQVVKEAFAWITAERAKHPIRRGPISERSRRRKVPSAGASTLDWHSWVVTEVLALHAANDERRIGLRDFRRDVLKGNLIAFTDRAIEGWLTLQQTREDRLPRRQEPAFLHYGVPGNPSRLRIGARPGGVLDWLRKISIALADAYDWDEAQGTIFVLTGATPSVDAIHAHIRTTSPLLVRSRITMTIDPTCTPAEVASEYRRFRKDAIGDRRVRRLGERLSRLAVFAATHTSSSNEIMMHDWNKWCGENDRERWRYRFPSEFGREAQRAVDSAVDFVPARASRPLSKRKRRRSRN